jgi:hypothetical protein
MFFVAPHKYLKCLWCKEISFDEICAAATPRLPHPRHSRGMVWMENFGNA